MIGLETAAEASAAIREAGFVAQLKKPGATQPDPEEPPQNPFADPNAPPAPDDPPEAPDPVPVWIVLEAFTKKHHDKWEIRATDILVMMEASGPVPTQGDDLEVLGLDYAIKAVDPLAPSGINIMFECQCRR